MFVCQSRFRNSIIVTPRNSGRSVEARAHASDNADELRRWELARIRKKKERERDGLEVRISLAVLI